MSWLEEIKMIYDRSSDSKNRLSNAQQFNAQSQGQNMQGLLGLEQALKYRDKLNQETLESNSRISLSENTDRREGQEETRKANRFIYESKAMEDMSNFPKFNMFHDEYKRTRDPKLLTELYSMTDTMYDWDPGTAAKLGLFKIEDSVVNTNKGISKLEAYDFLRNDYQARQRNPMTPILRNDYQARQRTPLGNLIAPSSLRIMKSIGDNSYPEDSMFASSLRQIEAQKNKDSYIPFKSGSLSEVGDRTVNTIGKSIHDIIQYFKPNSVKRWGY